MRAEKKWSGVDRAKVNAAYTKLETPETAAIQPAHFIIELDNRFCLVAPNGRNVARFTYRGEADAVVVLVNAYPQQEQAIEELLRALNDLLESLDLIDSPEMEGYFGPKARSALAGLFLFAPVARALVARLALPTDAPTDDRRKG